MSQDVASQAQPVDRDAGSMVRWLLALTQFLLILDTSVLNVAVPAVARDMNLSAAGQTWVLNAYVVAFGGLLLLSGCLAGSVGRSRVYVIGLVTLGTAAACGALATAPWMVLASRALQGAGAAMAAAASLAMVFSLFTGVARQITLGLYASMAGVGGAVGTVLGGVLTSGLGWRSTFWLNTIAAAILVLFARRLARVDGPGTGKTFNVAGGLALTAGLALAAYGVTATGVLSWRSAQVWASLLAAAVLLIVFSRTERVTKQRLVPSQAWRNGKLLRALGLASLGQWVLVPTFLTVSLYMQVVLDQPPVRAGLALLPMSLLIGVIAPGIPRVINAWGLRPVMSAAFAFVAAGMLWLTFVDVGGSFFVDVLGPTLLIALGLPTIAVTTDFAAGMSTQTIEPGVVSGLLTTSQQFGGTLGLASFTALASAVALGSNEPIGVATAQGYAAAFTLGAVLAFGGAVISALYRWQAPEAVHSEEQAADAGLV